jgi:hypothetical protein
MKYKGLRSVGLAMLLALVLLYPFESTVVPEWTVRVVDQRGNPVRGKFVRESWAHYSLELDPTRYGTDRWSDDNGYVSFPKGTIRASLARRAIFPVLTSVYSLAHGSRGIRVDVTVWYGAENMPKSLTYEPGNLLPDQIVVPSDK